MSYVETLHKEHLERQHRMAGAALSYLERSQPDPKPIPPPVVVVMPSPAEPEPVLPESFSPAVLRVEVVRKIVAQHFGVSKIELMSNRRTPTLVVPRQVIFYLCRKLTTLSLPMIGRAMGRMDHTTVLHGARTIVRKMETDERLRASVEMLIEQLGGDPE